MTRSELNEQIEGHKQRNTELLAALESHGLNENSRIDAEFHFWADEHEDAIAFAKHLYENGYLVLVISPVADENGTTWNLEARKREAIKEVVSNERTEFLVDLADSFNSVYDGWGSQV